MDDLSIEHRRFADEWLKDHNATRAYKAVYPDVSNRSAGTCGSRLLQNVSIRKYISDIENEIHNGNIADAKEIREYMTSVLRGKSKSEIVVVEGRAEGGSMARRMWKKPDEKERLRAAELLGKCIGMFTDTVRMTGDVGVQIVDDIPTGAD